MATVFCRGKRGILTAVWLELDPKQPGQMRQRWKSTGTKKRNDAVRMAQHWEDAAKAASERAEEGIKAIQAVTEVRDSLMVSSWRCARRYLVLILSRI